MYDTTGNLLTNTAFADPVKRIMQVHVCRNITKPMNSNCSIKGTAPVYMVSCSYMYITCTCRSRNDSNHLIIFVFCVGYVLQVSPVVLWGNLIRNKLLEKIVDRIYCSVFIVFQLSPDVKLCICVPSIQYDPTTKVCNAYGNIHTANIQPNPYKDG